MTSPCSVREITAYCGIDVGTQGVRAVLLGPDGEHLGSGAAGVPDGRREGGRHEQDPAQWWTALVTAVRSAVDQAGPHVVVEALSLDATSGTVLVQGSDGLARGPALMYDDARASSQAERARTAGAALWDVLGYRMQESWALPKLMWLSEHGAVGTGDRLVHQSDHLVGRLVGAAVATDTSHALKSGVDLRSGEWPVDILADLGLDAAALPQVVLPGTVIGTVGTEAAQATGLTPGTPVRAGMTDGCAAQIASRALRPGSWSSALGTTLTIKGSTSSLVHDRHGAVYCHRNPDGGWLPGGASSTGAGVIARTFPGDARALEALTEQAKHLVPAPGVTYALDGTGERFPFVAPQAQGFLAPEATVSEPARFAALCQSVAYVERLAYDVLGVLGADVTGPVSLSGGATHNTWWNQLRTDVLGRTTVLPESVQAATGMAVLAAAEPGRLAETSERMVRVREEYVPDRERGRALRPGYERFLDELTDRGWLDGDLAARVLVNSGATR
ncbi:FGGY-family carbohydrate kinase [Streptomyces sp. cg40]|uniref:FGGY-family carbohydrate kinase n=1 Tax=Streptomyces sp. cg40 TaxID=3419764 RepID=UPI003CFD3404